MPRIRTVNREIKVFDIELGMLDEWREKAFATIKSQTPDIVFSSKYYRIGEGSKIVFEQSSLPTLYIKKCQRHDVFHCYISKQEQSKSQNILQLNETVSQQLKGPDNVFEWHSLFAVIPKDFPPVEKKNFSLSENLNVELLDNIYVGQAFTSARLVDGLRLEFPIHSDLAIKCKLFGKIWSRTGLHAQQEANLTMRIAEALISLHWMCETKSIQLPILEQKIDFSCSREKEFDSNWETIKKNVDGILDTLLMFHQGMLLERSNPTFALVAYISLIESIGQKISPLRKCSDKEHCEGCQKKTGAMRAFKAALKFIGYDDEQINELKEESYSNIRSCTVHNAKLFGSENTVLPSFGLVETLSREKDITSLLYQMREVAKSIWLKYFNQEIKKFPCD